MPTAEVADLEVVLDGLVASGVYTFTGDESADDVRERVAAAGWVALTTDAGDGKAALLEGLAASGQFPAWTGRNWDALFDALRDLSWLPAEGYVVLVEGWAAFLAERPPDAHTAVTVLYEAALEWERRGTPFVVLLR